VVDVPKIMRVMGERADAAGYDLASGYIFPQPDNPMFMKSLAEFRQRRAAVLKKSNPFHRPPRSVFDAQARGAFELQAHRIGMQPS
jgi:hypothetical protein